MLRGEACDGSEGLLRRMPAGGHVAIRATMPS